MTSDAYPNRVADIAAWASRHTVTEREARDRYAQRALLAVVASVPNLRNVLVFKGGNALDFVLSPNRSTIDLDFSLDMLAGDLVETPEVFADLLAAGIANVARDHDLVLKVHSVQQKPPGAGRTFVTMQARVGYATFDQVSLVNHIQRGATSPQVIPVEVSINEPLVENAPIQVVEDAPQLRVATINDIIGEKLRAMLQQRQRNRTRRQDVLDVAVILASEIDIDRDVVSRALLIKAAARDVSVSVEAFHHPEIAERARNGYDGLALTARHRFIPFDEAFAMVLAFVETLDIPRE